MHLGGTIQLQGNLIHTDRAHTAYIGQKHIVMSTHIGVCGRKNLPTLLL